MVLVKGAWSRKASRSRLLPTGVASPVWQGCRRRPIGLAVREANRYGFYSEAVSAKERPGGAGGRSKEEKYADAAGKTYVLALDGPGKTGSRSPC